MKGVENIFYAIAAILVFIATLQRSQNEEELKEYNILFLPLFTLMGMLIVHSMIIFIPPTILNNIFLLFFTITGYWSNVTNSFFFIELTKYGVVKRVYGEDPNSSEFSELLLSETHRNTAKKETGILAFFESCYNATKNAILNMNMIDFLVYSFSAILVTIYAITKSMILAEIISMSICFSTIRELKLFSILNGYTVLVIYTIYDVLWLFYGHELKAYTAEIDVPIKLVLPMDLHGYEMVGFGDVLVPAFFIAICKKYGEVKNCISFWYVTYIAFCIGIFFGVNADWFPIENTPMMLFIGPTVGITALIYAAILGRTKEFLKYKRSS